MVSLKSTRFVSLLGKLEIIVIVERQIRNI